ALAGTCQARVCPPAMQAMWMSEPCAPDTSRETGTGDVLLNVSLSAVDPDIGGTSVLGTPAGHPAGTGSAMPTGAHPTVPLPVSDSAIRFLGSLARGVMVNVVVASARVGAAAGLASMAARGTLFGSLTSPRTV